MSLQFLILRLGVWQPQQQLLYVEAKQLPLQLPTDTRGDSTLMVNR